jgi:hypothetical protein
MMFFSGVPRKAIFLCLLLFMLFISSCFPMTETFYRPSASEGSVVKQYCPPVESVLLIERRGVIISISASASFTKTDQVNVIIGFEVPEGMIVTLTDQKIASLAGDQVFASSDLTGRVWVSRGHTGEFLPDSPMIGKKQKRFLWPGTYYRKTDHAYYWFSASLTVPDPDIFLIELPTISINEIPMQLPLIKFRRDKQTIIATLNC